jgi:hypothetical protein
VAAATPNATWTSAFGAGTVSGNLTLTIPPVSALVAVPSTTLPKTGPSKPRLTTGSDELTSYYRLTASAGGAPISVAFAIRRRGGAWQRVAIDDTAPYRAFLTPSRFKRREKVEGVAVARGADGTVAVSPVMTFEPNP